MSIYTYPDSKTIDQVTFKTTANGAVRAYLHAREDADEATVKTILDTLKAKGYECVSFTFEGKDMLEVRGFKQEAKLISLLSKNQWIEGKAEVKKDEENLTWFEKFRKRSLQLSGITYLIGDVGFMGHSIAEKDPLLKAAAFSYFLGTLSLVFYGRNDQSELQIHDLAKNLEHFLADGKIPLPEGSAMHDVATDKKKSILQSLNETATRYPSEAFNIVTALAGLCIAISSYKKITKVPLPGMDAKAIQKMRQVGWMDLGLGSLTVTSGTFATLVKEKKHDPDAPPQKGFAWLWEKIREHPLAIAGGGYTIATLCHAASTWEEWREARRVHNHEGLKAVRGRALFVLMALVSEGLLSISSKGHGEGVVSDNSVDETVIALAAEVIVRQPADQRDKLVEVVGKFLGDQETLAMKDEEVVATLRKQVETLARNPWIKAQGGCKETPVPPEPETITQAQEKPTVAAAWQAKLNNAKQQPAQLQSLA